MYFLKTKNYISLRWRDISQNYVISYMFNLAVISYDMCDAYFDKSKLVYGVKIKQHVQHPEK